MNTEDKQKAMLADDLSAYIKDKHTQEECIGFIDGYKAALAKLKNLRLGDVVGQSEQCDHDFQRVERGGEFQGNQCECGEWEDLT